MIFRRFILALHSQGTIASARGAFNKRFLIKDCALWQMIHFLHLVPEDRCKAPPSIRFAVSG